MLTVKIKNIIHFFKEKGQAFFLLLLCFYSVILHFFWLRLDRTPPWGNGIPSILRGIYFFQMQGEWSFWEFIKEMFIGYNIKQMSIGLDSTYPPLVDFSYFVYYKLFGLSSEMDLMVNSIYLIIGIVGVYGIGKNLFNKNTGLFSALIFASFPGVLLCSKSGFKEFQVMCFIALAIYFLLESRNFTNRKFSLLFGISAGLMMMVKYEAIIFLIVPLTIVFARIVVNKNILKNNALPWIINLMLSLIIVILIGFPWYILSWRNFLEHMLYRADSAGMGDIYFSTKELTYYFHTLDSELLTVTYGVLFLAIYVYSLLKMLNPKTMTIGIKRIVLLCFYFTFPFLFFSFLSGKSFAHICPLLVFASVIIAGGISIIRNRFVRFIFICLIFFHAISLPLMWLSTAVKDNWNFKLKEIIQFIKEDYYGPNLKDYSGTKKPFVLVLVNDGPLRYHQIQYYNMKEYLPIELVERYGENVKPEEDIFGSKYEYILSEIPTNFIHPKEDDSIKELLKFIDDNTERFFKNYVVACEIEVPRSSKVIIYKRVNDDVNK